jgi:hypothetical protein
MIRIYSNLSNLQESESKSFYTGLKGLGDDFEDYETNRKRKLNKVIMHVVSDV